MRMILRMSSRSTAKAPWQVEIDRGEGQPAEYHSAKALKLSGADVVLVTPDGEQVTFKSRKIRKILIMRTAKK